MLQHDAATSHSSSLVFGTTMVAIGVAIGAFGAWRYVVQRAALMAGEQRSLSPAAAGSFVLALLAFGGVTVWQLFHGPS